MRLKSLLLASAAVLAGQSAARAADAIIVEPEPVEYVRVCDAYGAGWFYIPGTETCLKIDGDVRIDYATVHYHDRDSFDSTHDARYRGRFNIRANNETEYGTLESRIRFFGETSGDHSDAFSTAEGPGSASTVLDWAVISLAGFRVGFADDYWTTAGGYGYYDGRFDGLYSYAQGLFLDYTYAANGWAATIGIEDGGFGYAPFGSSGSAGQPDVYGGLTYSGSGWYLAAIALYDSSQSDTAYKFRADYDFGTNGLGIGGWYMTDHGDTDWVKGHVWGLTAKMNLMDNLQLIGGYSAYADGDDVGIDQSQLNWTVAVKWDVVPGLYIMPEYSVTTFYDDAPNGGNFGVFNLRIVRDF